MSEEWKSITPKVKPEAEFLEIASDFGNPLEILREAISNAYDHKASSLTITFKYEPIDGKEQIVIEMDDNGEGMSFDKISNNFWDLGNSSSKGDPEKIGDKGHGTKIYLRSDYVHVITHHATGSYEAICERPFQKLNNSQVHSPKIREIGKKDSTGTMIRVIGYNNDDQTLYVQDVVKDYIYWFTKHGSFQSQFDNQDVFDFTIYLKCLDVEQHEPLPFGHPFPKINDNLDELFKRHETNAADHFVKKYTKEGRLDEMPSIQYKAVIYVEGDLAKRSYNPLLVERARKKKKHVYKVADRYGLWLAKDFIPVQRVNDWISGFGKGSNSYVLLHGFINCQDFKLTANRGTIANTNPKIIREIQKVFVEMIEDVDAEMFKEGLFSLQRWQEQEKTLKQEQADFRRRKDALATRKSALINGRVVLEPQSESETFGLFTVIYTLHPDLFAFEPLDYDTTRGIDILARNKTQLPIADCEFWYIELKHMLKNAFNHSFRNLRWIVCWDFEKTIKHGSALDSSVDDTMRELKIYEDPHTKKRTYYLEHPSEPVRITVIRLKELLEKETGIVFK